MSEGQFHAYVGLLVFSAVVLSVLAAHGFGQSTAARIGDGVFAALFFGYAAYLILVPTDTVRVFFYAFAAPVVAVGHAWKHRGRANAGHHAAGFTPQPYAGVPATVTSQGFPPPPPPLNTHFTLPQDPPPTAPPPTRRGPMSSGLPTGPPAGLPADDPEAAGRSASGLPPGDPEAAGSPASGLSAGDPEAAGRSASGLPAAQTGTMADLATSYPARPSGLPGPAAYPNHAADPEHAANPEHAAHSGHAAHPAHAAPWGQEAPWDLEAHPGHEGRHQRPEPGSPTG